MSNGIPHSYHRTLRGLEWAILGLGTLGILLLWDVHGISWDEHTRSRHGEMILSYFLSLGEDRAVNEDRILRMYTALPDVLAAVWYQFLPDWKYAIRHTVSALFALATVPALYGYSRLSREPWAGPIGGVILLTMPVFFGHAFINSKDIPFACAFAWGMLAIVWLLQAKVFTWWRILLAGIALGFPGTVRPGAWFMLPALLLAGILFSEFLDGTPRDRVQSMRRVLAASLTLAIAWATMVAVWPWAHEDPLIHPLVGIASAGSFPSVMDVLFEGATHSSDALPGHYLVKMLIIKTPTTVLLLGLMGLTWGGLRIWRKRGRGGLSLFLGALWLLAPIAAWTLFTPNLYDGLRHFLFVLPALSFWGGFGVVQLIRAMRTPSARGVVGVFLLLIIVTPVSDIVRLHPYEMTYFNRWVGGLAGAYGRYETEYWVTSYREAANWISRREDSADRPVRVLVAGDESAMEAARFFLPQGAVADSFWGSAGEPCLPAGYNYYLSTTRFAWDINFAASPLLFAVVREGAIFAVVRGGCPEEPSA